MEKFEQKINRVLSETGIPFVDYGIINSEGMSVEGFFRNLNFPKYRQIETKYSEWLQ